MSNNNDLFRNIMEGTFKLMESFFGASARAAHSKSIGSDISEEDRKRYAQLEKQSNIQQKRAHNELQKIQRKKR